MTRAAPAKMAKAARDDRMDLRHSILKMQIG